MDMKPLSYPVALDDQDRTVSVEEASRGSIYRCPKCKSEFVIRQGTRRKHFAHKSDAAHCSVESVIHAAAKVDIYHILEAAITGHIEYPAYWTCTVCGKRHTTNLVAAVSSVCLEKQFGDVRPDVSLLDANGNLIRTVEVVVSHEPETEALDSCTRQGVQVLAVQLSKDNFTRFRKDIGQRLRAQTVTNVPCPTPKCGRCGTPLHELCLEVIPDFPCYRCKKPMRVGLWHVDSVSHVFSWSSDLPESVLETMRNSGIKMARGYSREAGSTYWRQACPHCRALQGDWYIGEYNMDIGYETRSIEIIRNGLMYCHGCNTVDSTHKGPLTRKVIPAVEWWASRTADDQEDDLERPHRQAQ
jgi:ssDNA-binding Zn-finger/Zn-ribbon topoisomerase 1